MNDHCSPKRGSFVADACTGLSTSTPIRSPSAAFASATDAAWSGETTGVDVISGLPSRSSTVRSGISPRLVRTSVVEATSRACAPASSREMGRSDGGRAGSFAPSGVFAGPAL